MVSIIAVQLSLSLTHNISTLIKKRVKILIAMWTYVIIRMSANFNLLSIHTNHIMGGITNRFIYIPLFLVCKGFGIV